MNDSVRNHVVKQGENLTVIAEKVYGRHQGHLWKKIYTANKKVIGKKPNLIKPGMVLTIPSLVSTPLDTALLYDVDRIAIWLDRLNNLAGSIGHDVIGVDQMVREKLAKQDQSTVDDPAQKVLALQHQQIELLGEFAVTLLLYVNYEIGDYVNSLLSQEQTISGADKPAPTYLLRSLFHQVSTDLEIIQKAIHQRRLVKAEDNDALTISEMGRMLVLADRLAYRAIQPAARLIEPGIVTYFSATMHIRQIPYLQNMILLSIPFASVPGSASYLKTGDPNLSEKERHEAAEKSWIPIDLLAIPHELGHHLFHYLEFEHNGRHGHADETEQGRYARWMEELFADVYGCFVVGPISVLGLQAILADAAPGEWLHDDGHHPIPALRPFIATEILRQLSQHPTYPATFEHAPDLLDKNWEAILRRQGLISTNQRSFKDSTFTYQTKDKATETITINQLRGVFSEPIKLFIERLISNFDQKGFKPWSEDTTSLAGYDQVLRDLVYAVSLDENPKQRTEALVWNKVTGEFTDVVDNIKSILATWDRKGPEGGIVD